VQAKLRPHWDTIIYRAVKLRPLREMLNRIQGLDGIRALSILLVLFAHVADGVSPWAPYGAFGVEIFFVLSGYLITWLLCVEEDKRGVISLPSFYARRALRILPPAFLFIACASILGLFGLADIAHNEPDYCVLFMRNLMLGGGQHMGHFWSLAIEEQFYLLWPLGFLLLRSNKSRLVFSLALFIAAPFWRHLMFRLAGGAMNVNSWRFDLRYDALLAGCCLALLRHSPKIRSWASNRAFTSTLAPLCGLVAIGAGWAGFLPGPFASSISFLGVAIIINFAVETEHGILGGFLNWAPMIWIGQLSYSLYLWQQIFCWRSRLPWVGSFPQNILAAFAAASVSFYLLEKPLADLRKRIPYIENPSLLLGRVEAAVNETRAKAISA
jgi:peptidoglycan/LPS O-acetylase OafA/YrhL